MAINKLTFIAVALAATSVCAGIYATFYSLGTRQHAKLNTTESGLSQDVRPVRAGPLIARESGSTSPNGARSRAMRGVTSQPAEAQAWLDQEFPNKVYPEVTRRADLRRDDPAEYERQVRALNPDYAKVLDEEAASERAKEQAQRQLDREAEEHRLAVERADRERAAAR